MRMVCRMLLAVMFVATVAGIVAAEPRDTGTSASSPVRAIPGVTAPDLFPHGCVDCHRNRPDVEKDVRISTLMRQCQEAVPPELLAKVRAFSPPDMQIKGVHPKMKAPVAEMTIPDACLKCHAKTSKFAPPFGPLLHGLHLTGGEKNHFLVMFQGECTHCHKLDAKTGAWALGSGTEP